MLFDLFATNLHKFSNARYFKIKQVTITKFLELGSKKYKEYGSRRFLLYKIGK